MKTKYKARGVSLPEAMMGDADKRVQKLNPWVNSFSAYVQRLIQLDLERGLLDSDGGVNPSVVGKGKRPFELPLALLESNAVVV